MELSDTGLAEIARSEGLNLKPYPDHRGWSIGYGHLMTSAKHAIYKDGITAKQATEHLKLDAVAAVRDVNRLVKVPLTQAQFDALVDFRYNMNPLALGHIAETLNTGDYKAAAERMKLYNKALDEKTGELVEMEDLTARRAKEAEAFA